MNELEFNYNKEKLFFNLKSGFITFRKEVYVPPNEHYFKYLLEYRYLVLFEKVENILFNERYGYFFDFYESYGGYGGSIIINIDLNLVKEVQDIKLIYNFLE